MFDPMNEMWEFVQRLQDNGQPGIDIGTEPLDPMPEPLDPMPEPLDPMPEPLDPMPDPLPPSVMDSMKEAVEEVIAEDESEPAQAQEPAASGQVSFRGVTPFDPFYPLETTGPTCMGDVRVSTNDAVEAICNPTISPYKAVGELTKKNFQSFVDQAQTAFDRMGREQIRDVAVGEVQRMQNFVDRIQNLQKK